MIRGGIGRRVRGCGPVQALPSALVSWAHHFNGATKTDWYGSPADGAFQDNKLTHINEVAGGTTSVETTIVYSGGRSMKCYTPAKTTATVPKAHPSREGWNIQPGQRVVSTFPMYLPSGAASYDNLFLWDIEVDGNDLQDPALANNFFGLRLGLNASRALKVDREYSSQADPTDARNVAFPLNQWVEVKVELYCHSASGWLKVDLNGSNAFSASNFNTLPTSAQINSEFGTAAVGTPVYRMLQVGITANGNASVAQTAYFDAWTTQVFNS